MTVNSNAIPHILKVRIIMRLQKVCVKCHEKEENTLRCLAL